MRGTIDSTVDYGPAAGGTISKGHSPRTLSLCIYRYYSSDFTLAGEMCVVCHINIQLIVMLICYRDRDSDGDDDDDDDDEEVEEEEVEEEKVVAL